MTPEPYEPDFALEAITIPVLEPVPTLKVILICHYFLSHISYFLQVEQILLLTMLQYTHE